MMMSFWREVHGVCVGGETHRWMKPHISAITRWWLSCRSLIINTLLWRSSAGIRRKPPRTWRACWRLKRRKVHTSRGCSRSLRLSVFPRTPAHRLLPVVNAHCLTYLQYYQHLDKSKPRTVYNCPSDCVVLDGVKGARKKQKQRISHPCLNEI